MQRKPFKPVGEIRSTRKLERIHSDVCGPMRTHAWTHAKGLPTESFGGQKYFVTFIDDFSRYCKVYFIRHKSQVLEKFKEFEALATNELGVNIGTLKSDNGGEYEFEAYLKSRGIRQELTTPYSPQQNGVSERMNRTLMESARCMIAQAKLSDKFWAEAVATAAYLRNRIPSRAFKIKITPYERLYSRKPDLSHIRVFGCTHSRESQSLKETNLERRRKNCGLLDTVQIKRIQTNG